MAACLHSSGTGVRELTGDVLHCPSVMQSFLMTGNSFQPCDVCSSFQQDCRHPKHMFLCQYTCEGFFGHGGSQGAWLLQHEATFCVPSTETNETATYRLARVYQVLSQCCWEKRHCKSAIVVRRHLSDGPRFVTHMCICRDR